MLSNLGGPHDAKYARSKYLARFTTLDTWSNSLLQRHLVSSLLSPIWQVFSRLPRPPADSRANIFTDSTRCLDQSSLSRVNWERVEWSAKGPRRTAKGPSGGRPGPVAHSNTGCYSRYNIAISRGDSSQLWSLTGGRQVTS